MKNSSDFKQVIEIYLKLHVFLCFLVLLVCPVSYAALEKSSKKECAMCHVMWLDVFRTEKETLIEWQPGNVLMKDTQGIVSSEDICYSCHDGYVLDSRYTAWKYNNHTTFKKPSGKIKIPATLPLSNKDEIYCGTCHTPHFGQESAFSSVQSIPGPLSFLRLSNTDSELCEMCHIDKVADNTTQNHPIHTDKLRIPESLFNSGSKAALKGDTVICQTCHKIHGATGRNLTVMDNRQSALCVVCHSQRSIIDTRHDLRLTMPDETNIKGQSLNESGPCGACHLAHDAAGYKLWARKMMPGESVSQLCLSCHKEIPGSDIKGVGKYSHPNNIEAVSKDDNIVGKANLPDKLPLFSRMGKQQHSGTIQCFTCHNVHQWDPSTAAKRGGKNVEGDASNSFLRMPSSQRSSLCLECHRRQRSLLAYDHNLVLSAPDAKNNQGFTPDISGPCGACHIPHNAMDKRLWSRERPQDNTSGIPYCETCHAENAVAKEKNVGKNDHPVNVISKGKHIPTPDRIVSKLPLYNKDGERDGGNLIMCGTCHDPHIWSVSEDKTAPPQKPEETPPGGLTNLEGDARNSFLRQAAAPMPDLCVVCHEDTGLLMGTDHDLSVTAPSAKNGLGQTVAESGACGVCHAAHNSPEKRLLWARGLGPVEEGQHPMNSICTSCHQKGENAEEKIPPVAKHTRGLLMNNIIRFDNQETGYVKIFNEEWKEVNVGDLSCSSCHSFYRWDHRKKIKGIGKNVEGNAGTSFLRTSSDKIVCIDCHGETAIWRYTYFHSNEKRKMINKIRPE